MNYSGTTSTAPTKSPIKLRKIDLQYLKDDAFAVSSKKLIIF
jgi:hypothetical protein